MVTHLSVSGISLQVTAKSDAACPTDDYGLFIFHLLDILQTCFKTEKCPLLLQVTLSFE